MSTLTNPAFCYDIFSLAGCPQGQNCRRRHDILQCSCGLVLLANDFASHRGSRRHAMLMIAKQSESSRSTGPPSNAFPAAAAERSGVSNAAPSPEELTICVVCGGDIPTVKMASHVKWHGRMRQKVLAAAQAMAAAAEEDKNEVTVSHKEGVDFGVLGDSSVYIDLTVLNVKRGHLSGVVLETISVRKEESKFSATLSGGRSRWVKRNQARTLAVKFEPNGSIEGEYDDVLELIFLETATKERFLITRTLHAVVGSPEDHEQIKPKAAYARRKQGAPQNQSTGPIIRSLRPPTWGPVKWTSRLGEFKPPPALIQAAFPQHARVNTKAILGNVRDFLPSSFTINTYGEHFQTMLYIEDEQMRQDLEMYSMTDVELKANHPRYDLQVKGLAEGRPSVVVGDFILVRLTETPDGPQYEGRVHQVHENHVSLRFDDRFSTYKGTKFDVNFTLNRLPHRRMHQALTNNFKESRIFFPRGEHLIRKWRVLKKEKETITVFNRLIAQDPEQLDAVAAIVHQPRGSPPHIVFGPPGTGKTVTIVEAILQLLHRNPDAHILACAPSNSAADLIARKLLILGPTQLFRLNSLTRKYLDLSPDLRKFSAINDNLTFMLPLVEDLRKFRVVVSTCISGGVAAQLGVKRGHFHYIFVDEAGQATEPEVVLPIKSLADKQTNVILAGDNKQLGPIVHSWIARSLGLRISYLARLMQREIYSLDPEMPEGGSGVTIVKLVNNFRSHPAILEFSNNQFYNGELKPCGDPVLIRSLENLEELPKKKFPLIFHGIMGKDDREGSSPSFFNVSEASLVKKYVMSLVGDRKARIRPEEIGIITPYHAQRCKIMDLLYRDPKLRSITVGSVEEFQGQERRVIIMSTVRSNTNYVESDIRRTLGFVANPQRFNVAVTRAQALLIVIGNPEILALDPLWRAFMNYIHTRGGWRGKEITWNADEDVIPSAAAYDLEMKRRAEGEAEEMMARLKSLIAQQNDDGGSDLDFDVSDGDFDLGPDGMVRWDAD
ncbi:P-loop containing nucleoside triphosphate hydrolase protein [Roridomyces roridus]|uniref:RNA helicase n=1 Tax=Roridomyces roridus TaxID=1738132 RepID=A0AAD7FQ19_9AGAR|nr:P-loop containing nucleoside triphosphate hydrolase protein [Roridomyces roridus]